VLLGDPANYSDNLAYDPALRPGERTATTSSVPDDRLVFTEQNAGHEYKGIAALAIAGRVLRGYDDALARESVAAAEALWRHERRADDGLDDRVTAATELFLTTGRPEYRQALLDLQPRVVARVAQVGWAVGRRCRGCRARPSSRRCGARWRGTSRRCARRSARRPTACPTSR
jgi:hypothetical protein